MVYADKWNYQDEFTIYFKDNAGNSEYYICLTWNNLIFMLFLFLQYKSNIGPVWSSGAVNSLLDYPAFIKIFVYKAYFVGRMTVGNRLLINIDIYSYYFLRHDVLC